MKVMIELPETFNVTSREQTVTFGLESVPEDKRTQFFAQAALHGIRQAIGDSAASAGSAAKAEGETRSAQEIALSLMESKVKGFASGEWSQRAEAKASDPIGARAYKIALEWIKRNATLAEKYRAADAEGKKTLRGKVFDKYEEELRKEAKLAIEHEKQQAAAIDLSDL